MHCIREGVAGRARSAAIMTILVLSSAGSARADGPGSFNLFDLGILPGGQYSYGLALDSRNVATGYSSRPGGEEVGVLLGGPDGISSLGTLSGYSGSYGRSITVVGNSDVVVGTAFGTGKNQAFKYDGTMRGLGFASGDTSSSAYGISSNGSTIVGSSTGTLEHAAVFDSQGVHLLPSLPGGGASRATGVNDAGQIVGFSGSQAFLYDPVDGMKGLGFLTDGTSSRANAISSLGVVVGSGSSSIGDQAFLYDGTMHALGTLAAAPGGSEAYGINTLGNVVGVSFSTNGANHAFFYTNGIMYDLNTLILSPGTKMIEATGISDSNSVIGTAIIDGHAHAVMLTYNPSQSVPEPSSFALLGLGFPLAWIFARRVRAKHRRLTS